MPSRTLAPMKLPLSTPLIMCTVPSVLLQSLKSLRLRNAWRIAEYSTTYNAVTEIKKQPNHPSYSDLPTGFQPVHVIPGFREVDVV